MRPLAGFSINHFPFVVWSRENSINLVNIKEGSVEPLIERNYAAFDHRGQESFYLSGKIYGMSLHFTAKQEFEDGSARLNWCKMNFKPDLIKVLKEYGMLPKQETTEILKLMKAYRTLVQEKNNVLVSPSDD